MGDKVELRIFLDSTKYSELEESLQRYSVYTDWNVAHLIHVLIDLHLKEWRREKQLMDTFQEGFDLDDPQKKPDSA